MDLNKRQLFLTDLEAGSPGGSFFLILEVHLLTVSSHKGLEGNGREKHNDANDLQRPIMLGDRAQIFSPYHLGEKIKAELLLSYLFSY